MVFHWVYHIVMIPYSQNPAALAGWPFTAEWWSEVWLTSVIPKLIRLIAASKLATLLETAWKWISPYTWCVHKWDNHRRRCVNRPLYGWVNPNIYSICQMPITVILMGTSWYTIGSFRHIFRQTHITSYPWFGLQIPSFTGLNPFQWLEKCRRFGQSHRASCRNDWSHWRLVSYHIFVA